MKRMKIDHEVSDPANHFPAPHMVLTKAQRFKILAAHALQICFRCCPGSRLRRRPVQLSFLPVLLEWLVQW
jgi:hypothetical protein